MTERGIRTRRNINFGSILVIFLVFVNLGRFCDGSRIVLENGSYENILIALNENTEESECKDLIGNVTETLSVASKYLLEATDGRARLGKLKILIPSGWDANSCSDNPAGAGNAGKDDIYGAADIKISHHPIAMELPWTEQHKGCGQSGEVIYTPPTFFTNPTFTLEERSRIFLHEWIKFRYGVFEEYGFLNDPYYSACYKRNGGVHFTSCTSPTLGQLEDAGSNLGCEALLTKHRDKLLRDLMNVSSSILFAPHLFRANETSLCSNVTHNVAATTKQNFQCYRKSSAEIVFSHSDFLLMPSAKLERNTVIHATEPLNTELIWHSTTDQAYAFVIEDSTESHGKNKMRHVKQSIAEFLHFIDESGSSNMACLLTFRPGSEFAVNVTFAPRNLNQLSLKNIFLSRIPDTEGLPLKTGKALNYTAGTNDDGLLEVFAVLNESLKNYTSANRKWNVIFIGDGTPGDLSSTLDFVKLTDYSVSIVTFESSKEWLRWNSIKQTRKVLHLPICDEEGTPCSTMTSSLLTDHLLEILSSQQPRRYFQKVIDVEFRGNEATNQFAAEIISERNPKKFLLSVPRYSAEATITITSPSGRTCSMGPLYEFSGLVFANSSGSNACGYEPGNWSLTLSSVPAANLDATHVVRGFVEVEEITSGLIVVPSMASDITKEIFPTSQNFMVPVHAQVKSPGDHPVINAEVEAKISYGNETGVFTSTIPLTDDGVDPDVTKDDGVYSGFVFGYSSTPSFHSGFIKVKATPSTEMIVSIQGNLNQAALLEERLQTKCCGHSVPLGNVSRVGQMYYSIVLPSFRTGEAISSPLVPPPSRIVLIEEIEQTPEYVQVRFVAPKTDVVGGNMNIVHHYDLCLQCDDCKCKAIPVGDCRPVPSGDPQDCKIDKTDLLETLVNPAEYENETEVTITCGIRGVNRASLSGALSFSSIEILLLTESHDDTKGSLVECKYISDGCLPITIFWILIGLMSGLVLLLIIVITCWICLARKGKSAKEEVVAVPNDKLSRISSGRNLSTKASNANGLPDEFGTRDLFSTSIHRPPTPEEQTDSSFLNSIRRRSISSVDMPTRFQSNEISETTPRVKLSSSAELNRDTNDMPVFFANGQVRYPRNTKSSFISENPNMYFENQPLGESYDFSQRNSRLPSQQFQQHQNQSYPNSSVRNSNSTLKVPSISSMVDMKMSDESLNYREPVYASVNRNGRRSGSHLGTDRSSGMSLPPSVALQNNRNHPHMISAYPNSMKSGRPQSLQSLDSEFVRSQTPIASPASIRMDHFPSSESETYSEMSRGGGNAPPPPPPMPSSVNTASRTPRRHPKVSTEAPLNENASIEFTNAPRFASRTPPKENGFSILAKMGPIQQRNLRPVPPPPPPRSNSVKRPPPSYSNMQSNSRKTNPNFEQRENNFDDENDSDTWDVYDEFEFNPGVSHV